VTDGRAIAYSALSMYAIYCRPLNTVVRSNVVVPFLCLRMFRVVSLEGSCKRSGSHFEDAMLEIRRNCDALCTLRAIVVASREAVRRSICGYGYFIYFSNHNSKRCGKIHTELTQIHCVL